MDEDTPPKDFLLNAGLVMGSNDTVLVGLRDDTVLVGLRVYTGWGSWETGG